MNQYFIDFKKYLHIDSCCPLNCQQKASISWKQRKEKKKVFSFIHQRIEGGKDSCIHHNTFLEQDIAHVYMCAHACTCIQSHSSLFQFIFPTLTQIPTYINTWNEPFTQVSAGKHIHMSHNDLHKYKANLTQRCMHVLFSYLFKYVTT